MSTNAHLIHLIITYTIRVVQIIELLQYS